MPIYQVPFGVTAEGTPAHRFILENAAGTRAVLTDFGVTLLSLTFSGKDLILGYNTLREYEISILRAELGVQECISLDLQLHGAPPVD